MTMGEKPGLGELLLGTEGLALLRLAFTGDKAMRQARVTEMRDLLAHLEDPELAAPEHDLQRGYALWSETYDAPLRLSSIEEDATWERPVSAAI
ncbi:hypothetical protein [uncultured Roseibium sp.]|uniref:hypothetical protein n=1 Tax=uncultured Roseibium sp. TaxID=1936171 RepID=UPI0032166A1B